MKGTPQAGGGARHARAAAVGAAYERARAGREGGQRHEEPSNLPVEKGRQRHVDVKVVYFAPDGHGLVRP
jgi:hypothetical protein